MVARVGLISARFDGTIMDEESKLKFSAIRFAGSGGAQIPATFSEVVEENIAE